MIKIYHNPRCTKSRQGLKALEDSGEQFEIIKYLEDVPTKDELKQLLGYLNLPAEKLVRTNEAIWKENYKGKNMTEDDIITAMTEHPKLIERPIVIKDRKAVIGRPTEQILDLLQK
ncbi:arsenate reductase (glutaredoxin) [Maribacter polysaccharolyticus]|uniref:arsenate reductase (glutaredoxin) n=1 Tax=Maribacter polysaccharolyticus TaxID=3020831 RepID=UPI00237F91D6|nr:arsenate reductase (glutaredoxin) [Maribacter polysaccharolyticus]MDE3743375.1 arsenate reductase (glutaredoxin) [Maribacter polysaccharolyticus]